MVMFYCFKLVNPGKPSSPTCCLHLFEGAMQGLEALFATSSRKINVCIMVSLGDVARERGGL